MKESKRHSKLTDLEKRKMNLVFQAWIIEKMGAIVKKGRQSRSIYPKGERLNWISIMSSQGSATS